MVKKKDVLLVYGLVRQDDVSDHLNNADNVSLGSSLQFLRILQNPRWEDYEYEYDDAAKGNFLYFMGNGMTVTELNKTGNRKFLVQFDPRRL